MPPTLRRRTPITTPHLWAIGALCMGSCTTPVLGDAPPQRPPPACSAAEYRQFDFWLGEWEVTTPDGKVAGLNTITRVAGGCALHEHWVGQRGFSGQSLNGFDRRTRRWHQTWIDSSGGRLDLAGEAEGDGMRLEGRTPNMTGCPQGRPEPARPPGGSPLPGGAGPACDPGREVLHRIRWSPLPDGRVRQHWESSADQGRHWNTVFDGSYRHR